MPRVEYYIVSVHLKSGCTILKFLYVFLTMPNPL